MEDLKSIPLTPLNSYSAGGEKKRLNNQKSHMSSQELATRTDSSASSSTVSNQGKKPADPKERRRTFYQTAAEDEKEESTRKISIRENESIVNDSGLSNSISTTKYSLLSWFPISILEQFKRLANIYFLIMSLLMLIGTYSDLFESPLDAGSTAGTLLFVLMVTSVKEGMEDLGRYRSDEEENNRMQTVVTQENGVFVEKQIQNKYIKAGDIIKLQGPCMVPADMLLLITSYFADGNQCFIETANIDGETNLKVREAPASFKTFNLIQQGIFTSKLASGELEFEPPNKNIHNFIGSLILQSVPSETISLGPDNILLRGSKFSNTEWAYGIAIYTGMESKVQMNSKMARSKMSRLEEKLNTAVKLIFAAQVVLVSVAVISIYALGYENVSEFPYVFPDGSNKSGSPLPEWLQSWFTFFILFNNFIPISLYVTVEIVNMGQGSLIAGDQNIYSESLDCPTMVRASNMCQELGMVSNIFSDKTGTLTRNEMKLVKFIVDGKLFVVNDDPKNPVQDLIRGKDIRSTRLYNFLRCLTTCHTVIRESNGQYRAESPDELALVEGVGPFGCRLLERGTISMFVEFLGKKQNFEILAVNQFNADRKRMSVLLRDTELDEYYCMCKGADNIMLPLCVLGAEELRGIQKSLLDLAVMGLRTLVIAQNKLKNDDAKAWLQSFKEAAASLVDRSKKMDACAAALESGMSLLGITAIEDRLQDEVPEVLAELAKAGIITWMCTGDKEETAVNIGRSCNLILPDTKLFFVSQLNTAIAFEERLAQVYKTVSKAYREGIGYLENGVKKEITLVMDGPSFVYFDEQDLDQRKQLLFIGKCCRSVIGCRLTPTQKAQLVSLVKTDTVPAAITLAIGDGANDVSMIREGNVGVGIFGKEGRQAANNADFAIGEFKYLRRLLLVHGRWNYIRQSRVFLYSMHKNIVITLTLFWFSYYAALSGVSLYESWVYTSFNFCLGLPIIFFGIMDKDISEKFALANPTTYETSRENIYLTVPTIASWMLNSVLYATVLCLIFYNVLFESFSTYTLFEMGTVVFTGLVMSLQFKVLFMHHGINYSHACVMAISISGMLAFYAFLSYNDSAYINVGVFVMRQSIFWFFGIFSGPIFTVLIDIISYFARSCFFPTRENLYRETEHYKEYIDNDIFTKCFKPPIHPMSNVDVGKTNTSPLFC